MGLRRAAGGFVGGPGLLTLCTPGVVNGPAQLQACPPPHCPSREPGNSSAGTAPRPNRAFTHLPLPTGGKLRHEVMARVGTHRDTLTPGCKPLWVAVPGAQRQEAAVEKGTGGGAGPAPLSPGCVRSGAADTALGAGQWGRTDGSSGAAACACFRHPARPQAPEPALRSGHLLPGLGKGGNKPQQWKIAAVPIKAPRKPKAVSLTLPAPPWVSVPVPCATSDVYQPGLCSRAAHMAVPGDLHSPCCPTGIPWGRAGTPPQHCGHMGQLL